VGYLVYLERQSTGGLGVQRTDPNGDLVGQAVGPVVGRDTVASEKPDPEGLLTVVEDLDAEPESTVFVGDSERDAETARRAGTEFAWASDFAQRRYRA